jgi:hypothetical protein
MSYPRLTINYKNHYEPIWSRHSIRTRESLHMSIVFKRNGRYWYYSRKYIVNNGSIYWEDVGSYIVIKTDDAIYFNAKHKPKLKSLYQYFNAKTHNLVWMPDRFFKEAILSVNVNFKSIADMKEKLIKFKNYAKENRITAVCRI